MTLATAFTAGCTGGLGAAASDGGFSFQPDVGVSGATPTPWRPFSDSSPWNTRLSASPAVDPASTQMIADFSSIPGQDQFWINIQDYSIPLYWVDSTVTPTAKVMAELGATGFRTGASRDSEVAGSGLAPIPADAMAALGDDKHLLIVDRKTRMEWGFYSATKVGGKWTAAVAATQDLADSGARPPEQGSPWWAGHGPRACGFGLVAGLITTDEIKAGRIEHALVVAYPHIRSRYYTPPASTAQGTFGDAIATRGIMCGGRIQLDPAMDIASLRLSPAGAAIARALQEYGAFVGDYSGAISLYAEASPEAQNVWRGVGLTNETAGKIPLNRFRVLQLGITYDNMN